MMFVFDCEQFPFFVFVLFIWTSCDTFIGVFISVLCRPLFNID